MQHFPCPSQYFGLVVTSTVGNDRVVSSYCPVVNAAGNPAATALTAGIAAIVAIVALVANAFALVEHCDYSATSEDPQGSPLSLVLQIACRSPRPHSTHQP